MLVRPATFGFDPETAETNAFQERDEHAEAAHSTELAQREFDAFASTLRAAGIPVLVFQDDPGPPKPNAVFPNNWVSFHADGTVILYPMATASRRIEVRTDWIESLQRDHGFRVERILDWQDEAASGRSLEGTGSLVLDRERRIAYAALSPRTDLHLARRFAETMGYELIAFHATGPDGVAIYHTNVLLSVGPTVALVCSEAIQDSSERARLSESLGVDGRLVIQLSWSQLCGFAGNALEVQRQGRRPALVMSSRAKEVLQGPEMENIEERLDVAHSPIPTIERLGGGSARCMVGAVHLPTGSLGSQG